MESIILGDTNVYNKYHLMMIEKLKYPVPEAMIFQESITGRPGVLDYTSFYGNVVKNSITFNVSFNTEVYNDALIEEFETEFNGREKNMIDTNKPDFFWKTRVKVVSSYVENNIWFAQLEIIAHPNKFRVSNGTEVV